MSHDPSRIARQLIEENGLEEAKHLVLDAVLQAQDNGDNYRLSVWREVRRVLAQYHDDDESQSVVPAGRPSPRHFR